MTCRLCDASSSSRVLCYYLLFVFICFNVAASRHTFPTAFYSRDDLEICSRESIFIATTSLGDKSGESVYAGLKLNNTPTRQTTTDGTISIIANV